MKIFVKSKAVIYDANILVYYCFLDGNIKILELTTKSWKLTQFLVNYGLKITAPDSIMNEIKRKGIAKIVSDYLNDPNIMSRIIGLPKKPRPSLALKIQNKVENNLLDLENKHWFSTEKYHPGANELSELEHFFLKQCGTLKMNRLLSFKKRGNINPSYEDLSLISFSNDKKLPLISNDYDITCFADELLNKGLSHDIFPLKDIKINQ